MEKVIRKLLHGISNFQDNHYIEEDEWFTQLKQQQNPKVLLIGCSDSRVDPAILTGCLPGDIFVIRNVANLVPPCENNDISHHGVSAALEYAVKVLEVEHIVLLGHSDCGGIKALMSRNSNGKRDSEFIDEWLDIAEPAKKMVEEKLGDSPIKTKCRACEETALLMSEENLLSFPWLKERVDANKLSIHVWYFFLENGTIYHFDHEEKEFVPIKLNS